MKLSNQTILITGATSGIGYQLAIELHKKNNKVVVCGRNKEHLSKIAAENPGLDTYPCDITDFTQCKQMVTWVTDNYPSLNIVINNAGILHYIDLLSPIDQQKLIAEVTTNLIAPIYLGNLLTPHLQKQESAAIINVSSGLAFTPLASTPVYSATKAGIHAFTMSLRYQLRNTSIKVFEIIPPAVKTNLGKSDNNQDSADNAIDAKVFVKEVMLQIEQNQYEKGIGQAEYLVAQRDSFFGVLNP